MPDAHLSVLWPLPSVLWGPLDDAGAACPRLGQGEDGECRAVHTVGSSFLVWLGLLVSSPPNPIVSNYKAAQSH